MTSLPEPPGLDALRETHHNAYAKLRRGFNALRLEVPSPVADDVESLVDAYCVAERALCRAEGAAERAKVRDQRQQNIGGGEVTCPPMVLAAPVVPALASATVSDEGERTTPPISCMDCGLDEELFGVDFVLTRAQWLLIHPEDGGVLCGNCIGRRAKRLPNAVNLSMRITFADDYDGESRPFPAALYVPAARALATEGEGNAVDPNADVRRRSGEACPECGGSGRVA